MIFCKSVFSGFRPHQLSVWDESDLNAEALVEWDTGPVCRCILFRTVTLVLSAVDKTNKRSVSKRLSLIFCNGCWLFVRTAAYKLTAQILTLEKEAFTRWEKMLHEYFLWQHICMNRANLKLYPISYQVDKNQRSRTEDTATATYTSPKARSATLLLYFWGYTSPHQYY